MENQVSWTHEADNLVHGKQSEEQPFDKEMFLASYAVEPAETPKHLRLKRAMAIKTERLRILSQNARKENEMSFLDIPGIKKQHSYKSLEFEQSYLEY